MVKKWEIYYLDLNPTKGSEQRGIRPVLVVSNNAVNKNLPIFTCVPFSSVKAGAKIYPTEVYLSKEESGLSKDSVLMLQQIRTVATQRIAGNSKVAEIKDVELQNRINGAIMEYFELS